jgi:exoribonuclease-2
MEYIERCQRHMSQGKIIEYIDQGRIICAICLQDKGGRLHLLTPLNREINLTSKRAIFISSSTIDPLGPRDEVLNKLRQVEMLRDRLKKEIHVRDLWELIKDEDETFDYRYLAHLCFGETVTDDHVSALVRVLFDDKLYFKIKDGRFIPHSEEKVKQIIGEREEEEQKEDRLEKGSRWLKTVLRGEVKERYDDYTDIIRILVELALYGKESPNYIYGKELLSRAGISDIGEARKLLVRLGVWEEDEPVDIIKFNIRRSFTEEHLNESARLGGVVMDVSGREDLRDLSAFTIDDSMTKDFDDALSIDVQDDHTQIGIHIADVASVIDPDSVLDREACLRGSSLYLPGHQIHMFPTELSNDKLSLRHGIDRPAISLLASFDKTGSLSDYRFVPSIINIRRQLTYNVVNEQLETEKQLLWMYKLCEKMRQKRIEQGALILSLPEPSIHVGDDSALSIEMISQEIPSRIMVAELMILYNWLAARFCRDHNIPIIYRGQKEPSERLTIEETGYVYYVFRQRRKLSPLIIDIEPSPHAGLGLDAYSNLSSPIRRYFDLVSQRQMINYILKGTPMYNIEELEKIRITVIPSLKDLNTVRNNRIRYWVQKYLGEHTGEKLPAMVLDVLKNKYRIILMDYLLVTEMKQEAGWDLSPGKKIMIKIKKADHWNDLLVVEYAGEF